MTEERSCKTCRFHFGNSKLGVICDKFIGACKSFDKWQPIQKAPSFQMTEEEAREKLNRIIPWGLIESQNEGAFLSAFIGNLKDAGCISKSELVELVEEAEGICKRTDVTYEQIISKLRDALQALKKDHPDFGGKK